MATLPLHSISEATTLKTIKKYLHVWAENLSRMEGAKHHINTGNKAPVKQQQYKLGIEDRGRPHTGK